MKRQIKGQKAVGASMKKVKALKKLDRQRSIQEKLDRYEVFCQGGSSCVKEFDQMPLSNETLRGLHGNGFTEATEIQSTSLPYSVTGCDVVGAAKTGSGKTLAILIPLLECLWRKSWAKDVDGLGGLIVVPTRELAIQVFTVMNKVGAFHNFSAALLIGGTDVEYEKKRLSHINIIVGTPGRLLQHLDENCWLTCDHLQMFVIDEADRILDLGFKTQVNAILAHLPKERQTLLFSATQTKNVDDLARLALTNPVYISVHENAPYATPDELEQNYHVCEEEEKINILWSFLVNHRKKKSLIFVSCCKQARFLTEAFRHLRPGLSITGLWGKMNQTKRLNVFNKFNVQTSAALISTDVASRGLDFPNVDIVFQLDCPATVEDYIHRVGRTARMGSYGKGILVLTSSQENGMTRRLMKRSIPISAIGIDPKCIYDVKRKLQSLLTEITYLKDFAQKSFIAYVRSIYLMKNKDTFSIESIKLESLANSYGLAAVPRIRFLARQNRKQVSATCNNAGSVEKGASELLEMLLCPSKAKNCEAHTHDDKSSDDISHGFNDSFLCFESDLSEIIERSKATTNPFIPENDDNEEQEFLKICKRDVFGVLDGQDSTKIYSDLRCTSDSKKPKKLVTRCIVAKKMLKRGIRMNTWKKLSSDDEMEVSAVQDQSLGLSSLNEVREEIARANVEDKAIYKQRMKDLRKEQKRKKLGKARKKREEELDAGNDLSDINFSWLPDPDKPKKYDGTWNEIAPNSREASKRPEVVDKAPEKRESNMMGVKRRKIQTIENKALSLLNVSG